MEPVPRRADAAQDRRRPDDLRGAPLAEQGEPSSATHADRRRLLLETTREESASRRRRLRELRALGSSSAAAAALHAGERGRQPLDDGSYTSTGHVDETSPTTAGRLPTARPRRPARSSRTAGASTATGSRSRPSRASLARGLAGKALAARRRRALTARHRAGISATSRVPAPRGLSTPSDRRAPRPGRRARAGPSRDPGRRRRRRRRRPPLEPRVVVCDAHARPARPARTWRRSPAPRHRRSTRPLRRPRDSARRPRELDRDRRAPGELGKRGGQPAGRQRRRVDPARELAQLRAGCRELLLHVAQQLARARLADLSESASTCAETATRRRSAPWCSSRCSRRRCASAASTMRRRDAASCSTRAPHLGSQADVRHGDPRRSRDRLDERAVVEHGGVVDQHGDVLAMPVDRRDRAAGVGPGEGKRPPSLRRCTAARPQPVAELQRAIAERAGEPVAQRHRLPTAPRGRRRDRSRRPATSGRAADRRAGQPLSPRARSRTPAASPRRHPIPRAARPRRTRAPGRPPAAPTLGTSRTRRRGPASPRYPSIAATAIAAQSASVTTGLRASGSIAPSRYAATTTTRSRRRVSRPLGYESNRCTSGPRWRYSAPGTRLPRNQATPRRDHQRADSALAASAPRDETAAQQRPAGDQIGDRQIELARLVRRPLGRDPQREASRDERDARAPHDGPTPVSRTSRGPVPTARPSG